jgi:hypothetical protein
MLIGSNRWHLVNETDVRIKVDEDNFIISVETEKLLGIYIDKTLSEFGNFVITLMGSSN